MIRMTLAVFAALLSTSCATVMNDSTHPMRVDTVTEDGQLVTGADCSVSNDKARNDFRSGETVQVRRSARDLDITCKMDGQPDAIGRATSRANAGMWGNILVGGAVGAIVDHNKGTAYTYPTWVRLVFGWVTTYDRRQEDSGSPLDGERVSRTAPPAQQAVTAVEAAFQATPEVTPQAQPSPETAPQQDAWMEWRGD